MERLTIRNSDGSVSQPTDLKWAAALEKLAAYEDTGLTPEEIVHRLQNGKHWADIWRAEAEGRLLVLPCRVGTAVYRIEFNQHDGAWLEPHFFRLDDVERVGTTIFLTREEGDAAVKEMQK